MVSKTVLRKHLMLSYLKLYELEIIFPQIKLLFNVRANKSNIHLIKSSCQFTYHSFFFIQQSLLYRLLFWFLLLYEEGVPRLRRLIPQSFYYFSQVMCQEFRQCVRNELSLFHVASPEAGTSELTSSLHV